MTLRFSRLLLETSILIIAPIVLMLLPADYFDTGESVCLSVQLFDTECYGCGMTRSIMHLLHLDINESIYHNSLGIIVFVLLVVVVLRRLKDNFTEIRALSTAN